MNDLFDKKSDVLGDTKEPITEFGGKNKARRLARAIKKGKTAKAEKLASKVEKKVQKLIDKGRTSKRRYTFLTDKLKEAGEAGLSITELSEVEGITDEATIDDEATFEKELADAENDLPDGTVATGAKAGDNLTQTRWVKFMPNWATIAIPSTLILGGIAAILLRGKKG